MSDLGLDASPALLARARAGDDEALEALVEAAYPLVRRWALVHTGDPTDADDLTQDVLIRMIRKIDTFQGDAGFGTWLYTMTRNAARDRFRSRGRRDRLVGDPVARTELRPTPPPMPDNLLHRNEIADVIQGFFEDLPARQREVFDLVELQGIPAAEVAELLGLEPVSVRANLFKARKRLRERIAARAPEIVEDLR